MSSIIWKSLFNREIESFNGGEDDWFSVGGSRDKLKLRLSLAGRKS
jgi:hypothetical protein